MVDLGGATPIAFTTSQTYDGLLHVQSETDVRGAVTQRSDASARPSVAHDALSGEIDSYSYVSFGTPTLQHVRTTRVGPWVACLERAVLRRARRRLPHEPSERGASLGKDWTEAWTDGVHTVTTTMPYYEVAPPLHRMTPLTYVATYDTRGRVVSIDEISSATLRMSTNTCNWWGGTCRW